MKKIKYIIVSLIIAFSSFGCVTLQPQDVVNFVEPTVYFAATRVLEKSVSSEDVKEKAHIINLLSGAVLTTLDLGSPTPKQLEDSMTAILPDKPHWAQLVGDITEIYVSFYAKKPTDELNQKVYIQVIKRELKVYKKQLKLILNNGYF